MKPSIWETEIVIGGLVGTVRQHAYLNDLEHVDPFASAYSISKALDRALDGEKPHPAAVPIGHIIDAARMGDSAAVRAHDRQMNFWHDKAIVRAQENTELINRIAELEEQIEEESCTS
jgi:hypothetical protein